MNRDKHKEYKKFFKPTIPKIIVFLLISVFSFYFAKESVCAAGLFFAFCYNAYGLPFQYLITGSVDSAIGHAKTLFLGNFFAKYGNFLLNPAALLLDAVLIYILSCLTAALFAKIKGMGKQH